MQNNQRPMCEDGFVRQPCGLILVYNIGLALNDQAARTENFGAGNSVRQHARRHAKQPEANVRRRIRSPALRLDPCLQHRAGPERPGSQDRKLRRWKLRAATRASSCKTTRGQCAKTDSFASLAA